MSAKLTGPGRAVLAWWPACPCDIQWCGYEHGDCPLCQLLDSALGGPRNDLFGVIGSSAGGVT